jgi:hypothetical protein
MGDLKREIKELREKTARTGYQFLKAELQTCLTALEMAKYELSIGNVAVAGSEVACVEEGVRTIQRFLGEVPAEQRREVETKVAELQALLEPLKTQLSPQSR